MSAIDIVVYKLVNAPDIAADVVGRVFPILAPQTAQTPHITVHLIDNMDIGVHLGGSGKYWKTIIQVDCLYHADISGAASKVVALGKKVIEALDGAVKESITGFAGSYRDVDILLGSGDNTEYKMDRNSFVRRTRFEVTWREA